MAPNLIDSSTHNLIDYVIMNEGWNSNVTNCRSFDAHNWVGSQASNSQPENEIRENIKYDTKKLVDYATRQKYEDETEGNIQIKDQENIKVMWANKP